MIRRSGTRRGCLVAFVVCALTAGPAHAENLVIPHFGAIFGGSTNVIDLNPQPGSKRFTFGASAAWLSRGLFGVEADLAHTPNFFGDRAGSLVLGSAVTTVTGNLVVTVPLAVTRESLRPYVLAGVGWMHASSNDVADLFSFDSNLWALSLGGGAIGMLTPSTGVRFDLRQFRNLTPDDAASTTFGTTRLSFWRASAGVVFSY